MVVEPLRLIHPAPAVIIEKTFQEMERSNNESARTFPPCQCQYSFHFNLLVRIHPDLVSNRISVAVRQTANWEGQ